MRIHLRQLSKLTRRNIQLRDPQPKKHVEQLERVQRGTKNYHGAGTPLPWGKAERTEAVQPGEKAPELGAVQPREKAPGRSYCSLSVLKGGL